MDELFIKSLKSEKSFTPKAAIEFCIQASNIAIQAGMREEVVMFETNELEQYREFFEGAIFAYGLSHLQGGSELKLILKEDSDFDLFFVRKEGKKGLTTPIQLKRIVGAHTTLENEIQKLSKYADSKDTTFIIYTPNQIELDSSMISIPPDVTVGEIFVFGSNPETCEFCIFSELISGDVYDYRYKIDLEKKTITSRTEQCR